MLNKVQFNIELEYDKQDTTKHQKEVIEEELKKGNQKIAEAELGILEHKKTKYVDKHNKEIQKILKGINDDLCKEIETKIIV